MYCQNCGCLIDDSATVCPRCGQSTTEVSPYASPGDYQPAGQYGPRAMGPPLPTYLVQSILVTLFCCLPFGIVAIVQAAKVESKQNAGDYEGALLASNSAKKWCWVAFFCGLIAIGLQVVSLVASHGR
jgi:hypothetical protein